MNDGRLNTNGLSSGGTSFYFDYQNGVYGWNSSSSRGADTFNPFKSATVMVSLGSGSGGTVTLSKSMADYTYVLFTYSGSTSSNTKIILAFRTYTAFKTARISCYCPHLMNDEIGRYGVHNVYVTYKSDTSVTHSNGGYSNTLTVYGY